ncbi:MULTISPECIES: butyrate kinase [unclassified Oceanobacillus]|uniref:butyrate kinase n=1 Tax=unclassified Oceanobacillus TaxID=2630292 RepID=UPI001BE74BBC|nr:butyrate kinase [Oceanobacillus sp. ISL-74]MBT2651299.1 butyrate kinase [Oceanobacillus sp. ISL-73]
MQTNRRILVIQPELYATTIGVFENERLLYEQTIHHSEEELNKFTRIMDQVSHRKHTLLHQLDLDGINISKFSAVCGRGGLLQPITGGTYAINEKMLYDLKTASFGEHVSNLGAVIADSIAKGLNIPAYIVDPPVVDEMQPIARISGIPEIERKSIFHALNHRQAGRLASKRLGKTYNELNLIVIHIARGITIGAHRNGKIIDVTNGLEGEGPFTIDRCGGIPIGRILQYGIEKSDQIEDWEQKLIKQAGLKAYLHTEDPKVIELNLLKEDPWTIEVMQALAYQIAKEIGSMSTVLNGEIDGIVFTGNVEEDDFVMKEVITRINWIADIMVFPGNNELEAMNEGVLQVVRGEVPVKTYP